MTYPTSGYTFESDIMEDDESNVPPVTQGYTFESDLEKKPMTIKDKFSENIRKFGERFTPSGSRKQTEKRQNLLKTGTKGLVEGVSQLGKMMGPLRSNIAPEEELKQQTEVLDQLLPTEDNLVENSLRRGLQQAPSMLAFPGSQAAQIAPRTLAGATLAETAKEFNAPEWMQNALELAAHIGPDITKKLIANGNNKQIIEEARKLGLTDEQITPLIQPEFKQKWLAKLTPRRGSTKKTLKESKSGLQNAYNTIQKSPAAQTPISEEVATTLLEKMSNIVSDMPAGVRDLIKQDAQDLMKKPITGETLINFYSDINHYLKGNTQQLSLLKKPIRDALTKIDPALGKDFETVNNLYSRYYNIANKLQPNIVNDIVTSAEAVGVLGGLMFGYYPPLLKAAGHHGARQLAKNMLLNPRFQQLSEKMVNAIKANKFGVVKKVNDLYANLVEEDFPEIASQLRGNSQEDLEKMIKNSQ